MNQRAFLQKKEGAFSVLYLIPITAWNARLEYFRWQTFQDPRVSILTLSAKEPLKHYLKRKGSRVKVGLAEILHTLTFVEVWRYCGVFRFSVPNSFQPVLDVICNWEASNPNDLLHSTCFSLQVVESVLGHPPFGSLKNDNSVLKKVSKNCSFRHHGFTCYLTAVRLQQTNTLIKTRDNMTSYDIPQRDPLLARRQNKSTSLYDRPL